jgi:hypothetical protein
VHAQLTAGLLQAAVVSVPQRRYSKTTLTARSRTSSGYFLGAAIDSILS